MNLWLAVRSKLGKSSREMYSQGVRGKLRIKAKIHVHFPPVSTLYRNPFFPSHSSFSRLLLGVPPIDTIHGSRTNDVKTSRGGGRACDFFAGISGRNLICLIGVGPAGWEITGAKFEQSCTLERRKLIGVTPVSSTMTQVVDLHGQYCAMSSSVREEISPVHKTLPTRFFFPRGFIFPSA